MFNSAIMLRSYVPFCYISIATRPFQGRQSWGLGVRGSRPPDFGQGFMESQGVVGGSWTGREILSYHVQEICSKVVTF